MNKEPLSCQSVEASWACLGGGRTIVKMRLTGLHSKFQFKVGHIARLWLGNTLLEDSYYKNNNMHNCFLKY